VQYSTSASFLEAIRVAAGSLRASKLRTALTLLGIILATTTLIAVMSVIHGMNSYVARIITDQVGANAYHVERMIMIGQRDWKKWAEAQRRNPELSPNEFEFLRTHVTLTRAIGMQAGRGVAVQRGDSRIEGVNLQGSSPNLGVINNFQAVSGRFLSDVDDQRRLMVAFIGNDIRQRLFPNVDPVGKSLDIEGRRFEIVGLATTKGSVFGNSLDNFVVIPIQTFFKIYGVHRGIAYHALAIDDQHLAQAQDEARMLLRAWRHLRPAQDDTFGLATSETLVQRWGEMTAAIAATAVAVVSIFMVVGGVVIMNIMLAVVTERTHEIGIRKSVGARRIDILRQFLVESSMMAAAGGFIGVLLAWAVAIAVRSLTPVPMELPATAIFVGVSLSALVGLFFGIYPARRAAQLDPIEALRAET
jgi:putative ABC transport system permease protein